MPRSRDATVSCGCSEDEDEGRFDDFGLDDVQFLSNATPPEGYFSDTEMEPEVNIPSINVSMCYDGQGNVVPDQQHYSEAEEDFLNKTFQSPASQSRRSSRSSYGTESPPSFQSKKGRKAQLWGNEGSGGGRRPNASPAGLIPTLRNQRPAYARDTVLRPGQAASLIPVPAPRSAGSSYQDSLRYDESTLDYGGARPGRAPVNYQQQNIDNLKNYPDPRYTYVPKHKFPGKSPSGAQRRSEPARLRRDIASEDLDVSAIPIDANVHSHRKQSIEPMVAGMISHVCGSRGPYVERTRPPIPGINQTIHGGRFTCPALENARTWLPLSPADDDVQVIHSPRPGSDLQDEDDDLAEFEANEILCNNSSTSSKTSPKTRKKSCHSPEFIDLGDDSANSSPNKTSKSCQSAKFTDNVKTSPKKPNKFQQSPEFVDLCDDSIFEDMEKKVLEEPGDVVEEASLLYPNFSQLPISMMEDTAYGVVDLKCIEELVREEKNDVSVAVGLSMPSRVNTTLGQSAANISVNSVREGKSNVSAGVASSTSSRNITTSSRYSAHASMNLTQGGKSNSSAASDSSTASKNIVTWGRSTAFIPVMPEDRDLDHVFAANMTIVQEQGLSLTSPPHQITNLLFPLDEGECQITAIIDSVPLEGAIVPMRPSRMRLPPSTTEKMDELAVIADSFIRSAPDRMAGKQLNVTLGTNLNVTVVDLVSSDTTLDDSVAKGPGRGPGKDSDPLEASRSIGAINSGRLVGETDFVMDTGPQLGTWIQLRGHRQPNWFPGFYASLPSFPDPVTLMRTPSEVLPRAWYSLQSESFREEVHLTRNV